MRGISWLAAKPVSFSRRTLLHAVSRYYYLTSRKWLYSSEFFIDVYFNHSSKNPLSKCMMLSQLFLTNMATKTFLCTHTAVKRHVLINISQWHFAARVVLFISSATENFWIRLSATISPQKKMAALFLIFANPGRHVVSSVALQPLDCLDRGFESSWGHTCSSVFRCVLRS